METVDLDAWASLLEAPFEQPHGVSIPVPIVGTAHRQARRYRHKLRHGGRRKVSAPRRRG